MGEKAEPTPDSPILSTKHAVRKLYPPFVALLVSPDAEALVSKNRLSFSELLLPFGTLPFEGVIKDLNNQNHLVRDLHLAVRDLHREGCVSQNSLYQVLSDSVDSIPIKRENRHKLSTSLKASTGQPVQVEIEGSYPWYDDYCDKLSTLLEQGNHEFLRHYLACILVVSTSHPNPVEQLNRLIGVQHALQHTATAETASSEWLDSPGESLIPPWTSIPKWFLPNIFKYHVLVHDVKDGDEKRAEQAYQTIKMSYGAQTCHLLRINSLSPGEISRPGSPLPGCDPWSDLVLARRRGLDRLLRESREKIPITMTKSAPPPAVANGDVVVDQRLLNAALANGGDNLSIASDEGGGPPRVSTPMHFIAESIPHALSSSHIHDEDSQFQSPRSPDLKFHAKRYGECLSEEDIERIKGFVSDFCTRGLLPFVERQMRIIYEQVLKRRNLKQQIFSATSKWFGGTPAGSQGSLPPTPIPVALPSANQVVYTMESSEMQIRRLADLAFLFQHYDLAFNWYHMLKKEFQNDQAHLYIAGALEMATVCNFMLGAEALRPFPKHYIDHALQTYMITCQKPLLAGRACVASTAMLRALGRHGEAADQYIRMTTADSDLCCALFLEQASECFAKSGMTRKFALHMILTGHRFSKSGHRLHALRCYQLAHQVYADHGWSLAEDHVNCTMGHHWVALRNSQSAARCFSRLLSADSCQGSPQQMTFLREYLGTLRDHTTLGDEATDLPHLPLPVIAVQRISFSTPSFQGAVVTRDTRSLWSEMELTCYKSASLAKRSPSAIVYKPRVSYMGPETTNQAVQLAPIREPLTLRMPVSNPLEIPIVMRDVILRWTFETEEDDDAEIHSDDANAGEFVINGAVTQVNLSANESTTISLTYTVLRPGCLHVTGLVYSLTIGIASDTDLHPVRDRALQPPVTHEQASPVPGYDIAMAPNPQPLIAAGTEPVVFDSDESLLVRGHQKLSVRGRRLNKEKIERYSKMYGADHRLKQKYADLFPFLQVSHGPVPEVMLAGQTLTVPFDLVNQGPLPVDHVFVASADVDSLACFTQSGSTVLPHHICQVSLSDDPTSVPSPLAVYRVLEPASGDGPCPPGGGTLSWSVVFRAPTRPGTHPVRMLLWYSADGSYRSHHLEWTVQVYPAVRLDSRVLSKATNADSGFNGNEPVACLTCSNVCEGFEGYIVEIVLLRILCLSEGYHATLLQHAGDHDSAIRLQRHETQGVCVNLSATSHVPSSPSVGRSGVNPRPKEWTVSTVEPPASQGGPGPVGHLPGCNQVWPPLLSTTGGDVLAAVWQATFMSNDAIVSVVYGQDWTPLFGSDRDATVVLRKSIPQNPPQALPVVPLEHSSGVTYVLECPASLVHDFMRERMCHIPVVLKLSSRSLEGTIYLAVECLQTSNPSLRAYYRNASPVIWSSPTKVVTSLTPATPSVDVPLSAFVASPGVYDTSNLRLKLSMRPDLARHTLVPISPQYFTVRDLANV